MLPSRYVFDMLDTVLFEFDGVLADTAEARRDALISAFHAEGIDVTPLEYWENCAGLAAEDAARSIFSARDLRDDETLVGLIATRAERAFRAYLGKGITLAEGAREAIERLAGTRLGIVSRASREEIGIVLSLARLEHAFAVIVGAEDAFPPKPSPVPYQTALARLTKQRPIPARSVVVALEDGRVGIQAAHAAGIRCVAVGDLPAHIALDADGLLPSLRHLTPEHLESVATGGGERIR